MTDERTHFYGDDCPGGHLPTMVAKMLDRCIEAIKLGLPELHVQMGDASTLRTFQAPADIDAYAATRLPRELWGTPLRLVWARGGVTAREQSVSLTFCENRA